MRARDRVLNFLRGWALLTAALPMLIVYRAAVQPRYQWGLFGMFGQGITPGYFVVVAAALLAWAAVVFGTLRSRAAGPLFVALNAVWFASMLIGVIRQGQQMSVRGDALGVNISLAIVGPILFGALLILSAYWWWAGGNLSPPPAIRPLTPVRRVLLGIALVLLPVIVVLFGLGDGLPHTWIDQLAVVCVIVQIVAVGAALRGL